MEHRTEPRSLVSLPIRVILPGPPAQVLDCRLMDVSATGMRIASDVTLVLEELVAIEVEDQVVLAQIRHCHPEGDKFVAGVRRLHQVPKGSQRGEIGECVSEMIEDLERRVLAGEEVASRMLALEALDRIVGRVQADPGTAQAQAAPAKSPASEEGPAKDEKRSWKIPLALAAALVLAAGIGFTVLQHSTAAKSEPPQAEAKNTPTPAPSEVPPMPPTLEPTPVATPVPTPVPADPAPVKPVVEKPRPDAPAVAGIHHAHVSIIEKSWVSVNANGKPLAGKVMNKGEVWDFGFSEKALLHLGYGAGVEISVDGKSVGPIGGTLRMLELTAAGKRFLPWQNETSH